MGLPGLFLGELWTLNIIIIIIIIIYNVRFSR